MIKAKEYKGKMFRAIIRCDLNHIGVDIPKDVTVTGALAYQKLVGKQLKKDKTDLGQDLMRESTIVAPYQMQNPDLDDIEYKEVYEYDINSSYPFAMLQGYIDHEEPLGCGYLQQGEFGFNFRNNNPVASIEAGTFCMLRYKIKPQKQKIIDKINHYYNIKNTTKDAEEKAYVKKLLVSAIGYAKYQSPLSRMFWLTFAKQKVLDVLKDVDKKTLLYSNVDSICVTKPLNIATGEGIGQWGFTKLTNFKKRGYNVICDQKQKLRGISSWARTEFGLLKKDQCPLLCDLKRGVVVNHKYIEFFEKEGVKNG